MNKIKTLIIGQSPFDSKDYENKKYSNNCIFNDIAFIPVPKKSNTDKNYFTGITSYKRMLGVINKTKINDGNLEYYHNSVDNKLDNLFKHGTYLVNFSELNDSKFTNKANNIPCNFFNSDYFSKDITLICFGNKAIDNIKKLNLSNKILEFPHPSGQNLHSLWYEFYGTPREYNGAIEITNEF